MAISDTTVTIDDRGDVVVIAVVGVVDIATAPAVANAFAEALAGKPKAVLFDWTSVDFMASAGLTVLLDAADAAGGDTRVAVAADGAATSRPIQITGVDEVVAVYPTVDEALANLT